MTLELLESITHNDTIKSLRGKKDYAISEIKVSSMKGEAFFPSDNKREEKHFNPFVPNAPFLCPLKGGFQGGRKNVHWERMG